MKLSAFGTFAAWMAALFYFVAGLHALGTNAAWWTGWPAVLALLVGAGALFAIALVGPLTARAASTSPWVRAARILALFGLSVQVFVAAVFPFLVATGQVSLVEDPGHWLSFAGLGVWLLALNVVALRSRVWPRPTSIAGILAGAAACLVPVAFAANTGLAVVVLVCVAGGLALPAWFLMQASREGDTRGALRLSLLAVAPAVALVLAGNLWARSRFSACEEIWKRDLAAERARIAALRMPVLRGEALDENAAARYMPLLASLGGGYPVTGNRDPEFDKLTFDLFKAAAAAPRDPLAEPVRQLLDHRRGLLVALREATRCSRVDWAFQYERGGEAPIVSLLAARWLSNLLVVEGHERVQAGDPQGAAERYLDVARFGADLATQGVLIHGLIGIAVEDAGLRALGTLLTSSDPAKLPLGPIAGELARLEAAQASLGPAWRGEVLVLFPTLRGGLAALDERGRGDALLDVLVGRALAADSLDGVDPWLRTAEHAMAEGDAAKADATIQRLESGILASRNPITRARWPSSLRARLSAVDARARFALLKAAVNLEHDRLRDRRYPDTLAEPPVDPWGSPAALHYRVEAGGAGYALWSLGENRKDDGGQGRWSWGSSEVHDDIVLARRVN